MELEEEKVVDRCENGCNSPTKIGGCTGLNAQQRLSQVVTVQRNDFKIRGTLGEGSYGTVYLAEKDGEAYALKEVSKSFILKVFF